MPSPTSPTVYARDFNTDTVLDKAGRRYDVGFVDPRLIYDAQTQTTQRRMGRFATVVATTLDPFYARLYGDDHG